jgi:hypothetical protein
MNQKKRPAKSQPAENRGEVVADIEDNAYHNGRAQQPCREISVAAAIVRLLGFDESN